MSDKRSILFAVEYPRLQALFIERLAAECRRQKTHGPDPLYSAPVDIAWQTPFERHQGWSYLIKDRKPVTYSHAVCALASMASRSYIGGSPARCHVWMAQDETQCGVQMNVVIVWPLDARLAWHPLERS